MGDLVDKYQNAFIQGRQMTDNCLISHEISNWVRKRKKGCSFAGILKVDLSKAYDRIRWDFVKAMLIRMKFPDSWVVWLMQCITTVSYSILVNGEPTESFLPSVGLRQGDPLSSYIFILCMEVLSKNLSSLQDSKELQGLKIARNAPEISHLFFADDALFFFRAIPKNCWVIKNTLATFCEKSGEMINFDKSHVIFSPNTPLKFRKLMRKPLGVMEKEKIGIYLGCPMEVDGRTTSAFNNVIAKVGERIASWKFSNLSPSGRLILVNTILISLASNIISTYLIPQKITRKITSLLLKFWWGSSMDKTPIYWRKRSLIEKHKYQGGLSFRNITHTNKAHLFNQAWRIHKNKDSLIHQLYVAKYKKDPIQLAIDNEEPKSCSYAFRSLLSASKSCKDGLYKKLGNGNSIRLATDKWHPTKLLVPKDVSRSGSSSAPIWASNLIDQNKSWKPSAVWNQFSKEDAREIFATYIPKADTEDEITWSHTKSGVYSVKSGYWFLSGDHHHQPNDSIFWKEFWKADCFPKWKHFLWKIFNNALPTADNLIKRKISGINPICCLCNSKRDSISHMLRDCQIAQRIWKGSLGIVASNGNNLQIQEWIKNFLNLFKKRRKEDGLISEAEFIATLWAIWVHRNEVIFRGVLPNPDRIMMIKKDHSVRWHTTRERQTRRLANSVQDIHADSRINQRQEWTIGDRNISNIQTLVVDGAWKNNASLNHWQAAVAWKNVNNDPKEEAAVKIFANSAEQAEAYAILKAISDMEWRSPGLIIKTDNIEVIRALKGDSPYNKNIENIIKDIKRIANSFLFISCAKVSREEVQLAHKLATQARKS
ncbi:hypothetical protein BVRB_6g132880 [Beta vulgaris subsp. vulgaris]|nr:hypothetical protein BVRB_6g132880 [Beta vulgaris subsp. vulgaris]